jgi:DNA-binding protein HU-beta
MRERPARTGHNPKTGQPMELKASKTPVFKAGKILRDTVK